MKKYAYFLSFTFCILPFSAGSLLAQTGTCEQSLGEAYLDAGNVRARIPNNGGLFWNGSPSVYRVPKDGNADALFAASIWVGGIIDNEIHMTATNYGPWEFWPGPLDAEGNPPADCSTYDKVWEIRKSDLEAYLHKKIITSNLQNWPWQLGAPVIDGDGVLENYNLEGGDLPELRGDQRLWWIMNDRGNAHNWPDAPPLGLEVHGSAHAFDHPGHIANVTFYEYRLFYKNASPLTDAYFGFYADADLGRFDDDYTGSDSLLHLVYAYNADNDDDIYGVAPPAIGVTFLETAQAPMDHLDNDRDGEIDEAGELIGASSVFNGLAAVDPRNTPERYNFLKARWANSNRLLHGFYGSQFNWSSNLPQTPTNFFFSGDPVTRSFWSALNIDGQGTAAGSSDNALLISSGPFSMMPGDSITIKLAIVWSRGADHLDSVTELKKDVASVRQSADFFYAPVTQFTQTIQPTLPRHVLGFDQNFPNPFSQSTTLRYSLPQTMHVKLSVYDMLGRQVALLVDAQQEAGIYTVDFDAGNLPAGGYLARIELDHFRFTKHLVRVP